MSAITDDVTEGRDPSALASPEARGPEGPMDVTPETEASFEEIER